MTWTLWTRQEIALIVAILTLACVAAFLSIKLTRPTTVRQRHLERSMAMQSGRGNPETLHQEARLGAGAASA